MFLNPLTSYPRIPVVDAIRGFALLGVLLANIPFSASAITETDFDKTLYFWYYLFVGNKFISIFSILFGLGFYMQWKRAEQQGKNFVRYFSIRMVLLFLIGSIHGLLIWNGDILRAYALGGLGLLLIRNWPRKRLFWAAIICIIGLTGLTYIANQVLGVQIYNYDYALATEHSLTNSYKRYLEVNYIIDPWSNFWKDLPITLVFTVGCMLVGFLLGDIGFFKQPKRWRSLFPKLLLAGCTLGLGSSFIYYQVTTGVMDLSLSMIWLPFVISGGMFIQSLMYIAVFTYLFQHRFWTSILSGFIPVGKASLSNYIFQSIFFLLFLFHCLPPLQLYGSLSASETWLLAIVFFVTQSLISFLWLKKMGQGPIEYLWKHCSAWLYQLRSK